MQDRITDTMIEVQEDVAMVSPTGGDPFRKRAYFLKPIVASSIDEPSPELSQCFTSLPSGFEPKKLVLEIRGWRLDHKGLKTWVEHLALTHQGTWKRAGIYDALFNSMCEIRKKNDLVRGLGEKWCCDTNTFIFDWGEATISLEDVMVLGGFSVLGDSVFNPLESRELREVENRLEEVRRGFQNNGGQGWGVAYTDLWMKEFMNSGSDLEHEAFLVFWLSRYVFHDARNSVNKAVFSIAIRLARGIPIALAPAVLANIYRDLGMLKRSIAASNELKVTIKSTFHLVQVWAWERFLELRPRPNGIRNAEPRLARWDKVLGLNVGNLRSVLDSAGEGFLWRPYAIAIENWKLPKYFVEKEKWVVVGPSLNDDELLSFSICLRVNELVGFGTKQQYLPHRVAMQFGYDQDIPGFVAPLIHNTNMTWKQYLKELEYVILYIPSRLSEADASTRYLKWWKESMAGLKHRSMSPQKKAREAVNEIYDVSIPCIRSPKKAEVLVQVSSGRNVYEGNDSLVPPGFPPKRYRLEVGDPMDDDDLTISEALKIRKKHKTVETRKGSDCEKLSADHDQILASSIADEYSVNTMTSEIFENDLGKVVTWGGKGKRKLRKVSIIIGNECPSSTSPVEEQECASLSSSFERPEYACSRSVFEKPEYACSSSFAKRVSQLKSKVTMLEKIVEVLKSRT
ncbi:hypothetical protein ABKV19_004864 [Rosa sericea]